MALHRTVCARAGTAALCLIAVVCVLALWHQQDQPRVLSSMADMISTDITQLELGLGSAQNRLSKNSRKSSARGNARAASVVTATDSPTRPEDGLFYMYDLPEEFWWAWPDDGSDCSDNGYVSHSNKENSGMGRLVLPDQGLFLSWHGSLFSAMYNRMRRSSRRTLDPEKASLFVIPYDLALDGYLDPRTCKQRRDCTPGLVDKLKAILLSMPYFQRHGGGDHALLWSLGQYHPWPGQRCDQFMAHFCARCTITCYWNDATRGEAGNNFVSVPFSASYHWWEGIKQVPWDLALAPMRNLTAVYLGGTHTLNPKHTKIRRAMAGACNVSSECRWMQLGHSSKVVTDLNIADLLSVYKQAQFCLCPPGDDPTRKAVFDTIISGCIPVIFATNTLYNQHPWHMTEQQALDISVYIPGYQAHDVMSVLQAISPEVIRKKQEALAILAPKVQYAMPAPQYLADRYDNATWDPPFKDAAELTLDGMLRRAHAVVHNYSTGLPLRQMSGRQWGRVYNAVRVQVPSNCSSQLQEQQDQLIRHNLRLRERRDAEGGQGGLSQGGRHKGGVGGGGNKGVVGGGHKKSQRANGG